MGGIAAHREHQPLILMIQCSPKWSKSSISPPFCEVSDGGFCSEKRLNTDDKSVRTKNNTAKMVAARTFKGKLSFFAGVRVMEVGLCEPNGSTSAGPPPPK